MPNDPAWINVDPISGDAPEYNARELRRLDATLMLPGVTDRFGARSGVRPGGLDAVTLAGNTVTVRDLCAVVYTAAGGSQTGPYRVALQEETHELDPADGSNDRIDAIDLQVQDDDEDASGQRRAHSVYVPGQPASSPEPPALTENSVRLATVLVPAGGTPSPTLDFVAPYIASLGGILPVRDASELPTIGRYPGMAAYRQDADAVVVWDGSAWPIVASSHTPELVEFTSNSTFTKADFPWARFVDVEVGGPGGGSGGAGATSSNQGSVGAGGGGGGYARKIIPVADLGADETVTVGSGGGGGSAGGSGGTGSSSSFGTHCSATSGTGGDGTGAVGSTNAPGGTGGTGTGGDVNIPGDDGGNGQVTAGDDTFASVSSLGGYGGSAKLGGGRNPSGADASASGIAGRSFGGGAAGAHNGESQSGQPGASGAPGVVRVWVW